MLSHTKNRNPSIRNLIFLFRKESLKSQKRKRRVRPAPLKLSSETDESVSSSRSSLRSSSLSPISSSPTPPAFHSPGTPTATRSPFSVTPRSKAGQFLNFQFGEKSSKAVDSEPPKSPGRITAGRRYSQSPRRSPSDYSNSPGSGYPSPYPPSSPVPQRSFISNSPTPRSPSPRPSRTSRFASQPTHMCPTNLAVLASRRKTSLAARRHVTINPTSNFLELPG